MKKPKLSAYIVRPVDPMGKDWSLVSETEYYDNGRCDKYTKYTIIGLIALLILLSL